MRRCDDFSYFAMNLLICIYRVWSGFTSTMYIQSCAYISLKYLLFVFSLSSFPHSFHFVHHVLTIR